MTRRNEYTGRFVGGDLLTALCKADNLPLPVREHAFAKPLRRWRFDYAWPAHFVAVEIEGGAWTRGRHTRGKGFIEDMSKYNTAVLFGWRVLRYQPEQIQTRAITDLKIMLLYSGVALDKKLDTLARIGRYPVIEAS